jgi:hypothetical protein
MAKDDSWEGKPYPCSRPPVKGSSWETKVHSESWYFDRRDGHDAVYKYVGDGKADASSSPYTQLARSAILAIGVHVGTLTTRRVDHVALNARNPAEF